MEHAPHFHKHEASEPGNLRTDAACSVPTFALRVDKVINWKESRLDSVSGFGQNEAQLLSNSRNHEATSPVEVEYLALPV